MKAVVILFNSLVYFSQGKMKAEVDKLIQEQETTKKAKKKKEKRKRGPRMSAAAHTEL